MISPSQAGWQLATKTVLRHLQGLRLDEQEQQHTNNKYLACSNKPSKWKDNSSTRKVYGICSYSSKKWLQLVWWYRLYWREKAEQQAESQQQQSFGKSKGLSEQQRKRRRANTTTAASGGSAKILLKYTTKKRTILSKNIQRKIFSNTYQYIWDHLLLLVQWLL